MGILVRYLGVVERDVLVVGGEVRRRRRGVVDEGGAPGILWHRESAQWLHDEMVMP